MPRKQPAAPAKPTARKVRVVLCAPPDYVAETAPVWAQVTDLGGGSVAVKLRFAYPGVQPAAGWHVLIDHETLTVASVAADGTLTCQVAA
jgi:hypothetical protein